MCPGSLRGCAGLYSVKQLGAARCKLVLSPLSLWAAALSPVSDPAGGAAAALALQPPWSCTPPGAHPGTAVTPESPGCTPELPKGGLSSTGMEERAATRGLEVLSGQSPR